MILAVDLGGTALRLGLGDGRGPWRQALRQPRPDPLTPETLASALRAALAGWGGPAIAGCGLSVAAVVDGGAVIRCAENLGWRDLPLARLMAEELGCPVRLDTDVFCGARYEARHGLARDAGSVLYLAIGTGIGHALVLDGRLWRGAGGSASAIGHLALRDDGDEAAGGDAPACYCGHRGCLCLTASGRAGAAGTARLADLARALGIATTLVEPERVLLSGGALDQPWLDLDRLRALLPGFAYPGARLPDILASAVPDPNLRGAACLFDDEEP